MKINIAIKPNVDEDQVIHVMSRVPVTGEFVILPYYRLDDGGWRSGKNTVYVVEQVAHILVPESSMVAQIIVSDANEHSGKIGFSKQQIEALEHMKHDNPNIEPLDFRQSQ